MLLRNGLRCDGGGGGEDTERSQAENRLEMLVADLSKLRLQIESCLREWESRLEAADGRSRARKDLRELGINLNYVSTFLHSAFTPAVVWEQPRGRSFCTTT